jgi:ABC-type phosphate transport system substrate-binding protein
VDWSDAIKEIIRGFGYQREKISDFIKKSRDLNTKVIDTCLLNNLYSMHEYLLNRINIKYFSTQLNFFHSNDNLIRYVASNDNAIGCISSTNQAKGCKVISLNNVEINRKNIINNNYELTRKFYIFIPLKYQGIEMIDFVFFLRSKKTQNKLRKMGFVRP